MMNRITHIIFSCVLLCTGIHSAWASHRHDLIQLKAQASGFSIQQRFKDAVKVGRLDTVKYLVEEFPFETIIPNQPEGKTFLHDVIQSRNLDLIRLVYSRLNSGPYAKDAATVGLALAVDSGQLNVVQLLLEHGADINCLISLPGYFQYPDFSDKNQETPLTRAIGQGHTELARLLLKQGALVNLKNSYHDTALMIAARKGRPDLVEILLEYDADISLQTKRGETALDHATESTDLAAILETFRNSKRNLKLDLNSLLIRTIKKRAVARHQLPRLNDLIQAGAKVNPPEGSTDSTPLIEAASIGHSSTVFNFLLKEGADVHRQNKAGETPLTSAVRSPEKMAALLKKGADVNMPNRNGKTALDLVLNTQDMSNQYEALSLLLRAGANPNPKPGQTPPLDRAIELKNFRAAELLTEAGAKSTPQWSLDHRSSNRLVRLESAVALGKVDEVKKQIANQSSYSKEYLGESSHFLKLAIQSGSSETVQLILNQIPKKADVLNRVINEVILIASQQGQNTILQDLLDRQISLVIDSRSTLQSALAAAIQNDHLETVHLLLAHGAQPDVSLGNYPKWQTALHMAVYYENKSILKALLQFQESRGQKINVDARDETRITPLMEAIKYGDFGTIQMLLNAGADPFISVPNKKKGATTPLEEAAAEGYNSEVVRVLLEYKPASLSADALCPPLFAAVKRDSPVVQELLNAGADPNCKDQKGNTPLMQTSRLYFTNALPLLLKSGADINARNHQGETALSQAAQDNEIELATLLITHGAQVEPLIEVDPRTGQAPVRPLLKAVSNQKVEEQDGRMVHLLLAAGARLDPAVWSQVNSRFTKIQEILKQHEPSPVDKAEPQIAQLLSGEAKAGEKRCPACHSDFYSLRHYSPTETFPVVPSIVCPKGHLACARCTEHWKKNYPDYCPGCGNNPPGPPLSQPIGPLLPGHCVIAGNPALSDLAAKHPERFSPFLPDGTIAEHTRTAGAAQ